MKDVVPTIQYWIELNVAKKIVIITIFDRQKKTQFYDIGC